MDVGTVVVGAGVVGLAVGRALALSGRDVVVVEREAQIGSGTSSRNSGVVHAGIYYAAASLKAQFCVRGRESLYEFCGRRGVPIHRCGKLIVATRPEEIGVLESYCAAAAANGAGPLDWMTPAAVAALEPNARCVAALHSPASGIVDVHALMQAYAADIASAGGQVVTRTGVRRVLRQGDTFVVELDDADGSRVGCREVVNSCGLDAPAIARRIEGVRPATIPRSFFALGHYYSLTGSQPFSRLVYPVAESAGLGIHVTLDLAGRIRFGPDVEWIGSIDYTFGRDRRSEFAAAIRRYYPDLEVERLAPDFTGIRPKIVGPGEAAADFRIDGAAVHGVPGLVNLFGIESPGLTASLAIGERVLAELDASTC